MVISCTSTQDRTGLQIIRCVAVCQPWLWIYKQGLSTVTKYKTGTNIMAQRCLDWINPQAAHCYSNRTHLQLWKAWAGERRFPQRQTDSDPVYSAMHFTDTVCLMSMTIFTTYNSILDHNWKIKSWHPPPQLFLLKLYESYLPQQRCWISQIREFWISQNPTQRKAGPKHWQTSLHLTGSH